MIHIKLTIDPEFKSLIPPLTAEEYQKLEENVLKDGCRDAITVWRTKGKPESKNSVTMDTTIDTVIDGHNRYEICTKHNISLKTYPMWFDSREEVKIWIIKNQLGRRNLDTPMRAEMALQLQELMKPMAKKNQATSTGGTKPQLLTKTSKAENPVEPINTRKEAAKASGISENTLYKYDALKRNAEPDLMDRVKKGEIKIHPAYKEMTCTRSEQPEENADEPDQVEETYGDEVDKGLAKEAEPEPIEKVQEVDGIDLPDVETADAAMHEQALSCSPEGVILGTPGSGKSFVASHSNASGALSDLKGNVYKVTDDVEKMADAYMEDIIASLDADKEIVITSEHLIEDMESITKNYARNLYRCVEEYKVNVSQNDHKKMIAVLKEAETAIQFLKGAYKL